MIEIIETINRNLSWLRNPNSKLAFMSIGKSSKVIIFVFESKQTQPTLCIKTVRNYNASSVIKNNHKNLKILKSGVSNCSLSSMFAEPLYFYDDGNLIFCIESVCPGVLFSTTNQNPDIIINKYISWQTHLMKQTGQNSSLLQHGDLTADNVLIKGQDVNFIDYDHVGISTLPGFDLFNFLMKLKNRNGSLRLNCERYFPIYYERIGLKIKPSEYDKLFFDYYLEEGKRKGDIHNKIGYEKAINNFKTVMVS